MSPLDIALEVFRDATCGVARRQMKQASTQTTMHNTLNKAYPYFLT